MHLNPASPAPAGHQDHATATPHPATTWGKPPGESERSKHSANAQVKRQAKTAGGCGGLGRRGDLCDEYISEAVLAKLEERAMTADSSEPWQGEADLERQREKLARLRAEWDDDHISDELFFGSARRLEDRIRQLRSEQAKHALTAERASRAAATDVAELRARWYEAEDAGGLPISIKRAYLRESLHAVIVHPAGGGRKPFNPDLLELIWRY